MPLSKFQRWLLLAITGVFCAHWAAGEDTWTEVRSPHFRVVTNGSGKDGRRVANEFEQMRHVFALRFGEDQLESGAPLTIVATRDEATFSQLDPVMWKSSHGGIAGVFYRRWEKQFAIIRLDTWGDDNQIVIFHEYTHSVLHANAHWLPVWLDEGMAEFYAYTRFQSDGIYVGAPSKRLRELRRNSLIPISTMLEIGHASKEYYDEARVQLFYGEAWAMVHYAVFGPGMGNGEKLSSFFKLLQDNVPQEQAFEQVFGDPKKFEQALSTYLSHFTFPAGLMPADRGIDQKTFLERKLTEAEADYEQGTFQVGTRNRALGRTLLEKSVQLDDKLGVAHEELGYLDFDEGKDDDAKREWNEAYARDPSLGRALFALTMSGLPLSQQTKEQLRTTQATLRHVTVLNPRYAPAYVELALLEWRLGYTQLAYKDARQAEKLEPWRAGYRLLTARILLRGHQPALAAEASRYVATHWNGPDHDEAVEMMSDVPVGLRGDGPPLQIETTSGTEVVRGVVKGVTCGEEAGKRQVSVTLQPSNTPSQPLVLTKNGGFMSGFSDTLWWGEDHFSLCHHLEGYPAVIMYKPGGELVNVEIRDELPPNEPPADPTNSRVAAVPAQP